MSENLARILTETAAKHGDRTAFKLDDVELTYAVLDESSARIAGLLSSKGVGPGDRVGLMLPNVPYFPAIYYGILRAGAVVVPMNVLLKEREVSYYLGDSGAKLLFAWHDFAAAAEAGAAESGAECVLVKPGEFEQLVVAGEPVRELGRPRRRRHRGDPLHERDHRAAQGRRADPREPEAQLRERARRSPSSTRTRCCSERCRCSTPSARPAR